MLKWRSLIILAFIIIAIGVGYAVLTKSSPSKSVSPSLTGCVAENLSAGSQGSCVSDAQTMVNFMETDDLTECPFNNGTRLVENGQYTTQTTDQIQAVQQWENCYNKQEGSSATVIANGTIGASTWSELCTYAYHFPLQAGSSASSYRQASLAAGKAAGCQQLF